MICKCQTSKYDLQGSKGIGWIAAKQCECLTGEQDTSDTSETIITPCQQESIGGRCVLGAGKLQIGNIAGIDRSHIRQEQSPASRVGVLERRPLSEGERQQLLAAQSKKEQAVRLQILEFKGKSHTRSLAKTRPARGWLGLLHTDYGLHYYPPETEGCDDPPEDDCPRLTISEAANGGYASDIYGDYPYDEASIPDMNKYPGMAINNMDISNYINPNDPNGGNYNFGKSLLVSSYDTNPYPFIWTQAPDELLQLWQSPPMMGEQWAFDDSSCNWLYMSVGPSDASNCIWPSLLGQTFPNDVYHISPSANTFLVSALMPYAVYDIKNIRLIKNCSNEYKLLLRIRYWVGVTHHFSFFIPHSYATGETKDKYTVEDLPPECWDGGSDTVSDIGVRVNTWMKMGQSCQAIVGVDVPDANSPNNKLFLPIASRKYFCNVSDYADENIYAHDFDNYYYYKTVNHNRIQETSSYCFSNHAAYGQGFMTSLLGIHMTGEVCFAMEEFEEISDIVKEGFRALFGSPIVQAVFENQFWGGPSGRGGDTDTEPISVFRRLFINDRSLITVSEFYQNVYALRTSDSGKWLFRSSDADRLLSAANTDTLRPDQEKPCCA